MKNLVILLTLCLYAGFCGFAQVGINVDNSEPDNSAMLDVKSTTKGMLVPRMTALQRNTISSPARGLLIFCTDNNQYYSNIGSPLSPNWVMVNSQWTTNGTNIYFTGGKVGVGTPNPATILDIAGGNNWDLTNGEGDFRIGDSEHRLKMGVALGGGGAGAAGIMQYGHTGGYNVLSIGAQGNYLLFVNGGTQRVGIGINYPAATFDVHGTLSVVDGTQGAGKVLTSDANGLASWETHTSLSGTTPGDMQYWNGSAWVILSVGSAGQVLTLINGVPAWWGAPSFICGISITINHVAGTIAPVTKTVTYGTVTNIPGENSKCWITSNLGADHQASGKDDATEASAGWYWQFNRKQGYKHDGTIRTPNTTWMNSISENSDWAAANDPCSLQLGSGWRLPTYSEWTNVANWTDWDGAWTSGLKLHGAGYVSYSNGSLYNRGWGGYQWSSTQFGATGGSFSWCLQFWSDYLNFNTKPKADGNSVRCLREN